MKWDPATRASAARTESSTTGLPASSRYAPCRVRVRGSEGVGCGVLRGGGGRGAQLQRRQTSVCAAARMLSVCGVCMCACAGSHVLVLGARGPRATPTAQRQHNHAAPTTPRLILSGLVSARNASVTPRIGSRGACHGVRACVCVRACVRACVCVCVCANGAAQPEGQVSPLPQPVAIAVTALRPAQRAAAALAAARRPPAPAAHGPTTALLLLRPTWQWTCCMPAGVLLAAACSAPCSGRSKQQLPRLSARRRRRPPRPCALRCAARWRLIATNRALA
jgi:hypothetical protein